MKYSLEEPFLLNPLSAALVSFQKPTSPHVKLEALYGFTGRELTQESSKGVPCVSLVLFPLYSSLKRLCSK